MVHASALHSVTAKYLNLELSTGNFGGLRMGVCSTTTTTVKLGRRATRRVRRGPPGTPSTGAASSCRHQWATQPRSSMPWCRRSGVIAAHCMVRRCSRTAPGRLRRRDWDVGFQLLLFCFKNKYSISIYVYPFVYISTTILYINLYCQTETNK